MKNKNKIPTAEELFHKYSETYHFEEGDPEHLVDEGDFKKAIIEFAKLHVEAALEAVKYHDETNSHISNAYPLENIK